MAEIAIATAAVLGVVGAAVSTSIGVASAVEQQKQARANADAQAAQLEYNKRLQEREAAAIEAENAANARRQREENEAFKARQRALLGVSGAALDSGSPLAILGQTAAEQETQQHDLQYKGYREAAAAREQGKQYGYQASLAKNSVSSTGTNLAILGHLVNGTTAAASTAANYYAQKNIIGAKKIAR